MTDEQPEKRNTGRHCSFGAEIDEPWETGHRGFLS